MRGSLLHLQVEALRLRADGDGFDLPQRTEVGVRTADDGECEARLAERDRTGREQKALGEGEVRVARRALRERVVAGEQRRSHRLRQLGVAEELEAVEDVVTGERPFALLLAVRVQDDGLGLEVERVGAHSPQAVVRMVHELHRRRNGVDGEVLRRRWCARGGRRSRADDDERGDYEQRARHPSSSKSIRWEWRAAAPTFASPRTPMYFFVPPVTTMVNPVALKSIGPEATSVLPAVSV